MHNKKGFFSPATIFALMLAILALGLPFITSGPVKNDDILKPAPETTAETNPVPEQSQPVITTRIFTTKNRTEASSEPIATTSRNTAVTPAAPISDETINNVKAKALKLEEIALGLFRDYGEELTAEMVREKAGIPDDEHFIVTVSIKNGNISRISYFTKDFSVSYSAGKYSSLANIADDDFEDRVLFL